MIGQDDDRALGIEKADHVVVIGDAAPPVRGVAQICTAQCKQLFAFSVSFVQVMKDIRRPAEAIALLKCRRGRLHTTPSRDQLSSRRCIG
jgi:hypothetical protein